MKRYIVRKEVFEDDVNTIKEAAIIVEQLNKNLKIIGQDAKYLVWDTVGKRYLTDSELFT